MLAAARTEDHAATVPVQTRYKTVDPAGGACVLKMEPFPSGTSNRKTLQLTMSDAQIMEARVAAEHKELNALQ